MSNYRLPNAGIQVMQANTTGRDFIVGDIQGGWVPLESALDGVRFDPHKDRLFAVGDLIDRGPSSWRVLRKFGDGHPFYSVMGNHEAMMMLVLGKHIEKNSPIEDVWMRNGGTWSNVLTENEKHTAYTIGCMLPLAIELPLLDGRRAGIVHAELPPGSSWNELSALQPELFDAIDDSAQTLAASLLWGRKRGTAISEHLKPNPHSKAMKAEKRAEVYANTLPVRDIDCVACGHEIMESPALPHLLGNVLFLDTGCSKPSGRGRLTLWEPNANQYWQVTDSQQSKFCWFSGPFPTPKALETNGYLPKPPVVRKNLSFFRTPR